MSSQIYRDSYAFACMNQNADRCFQAFQGNAYKLGPEAGCIDLVSADKKVASVVETLLEFDELSGDWDIPDSRYTKRPWSFSVMFLLGGRGRWRDMGKNHFRSD